MVGRGQVGEESLGVRQEGLGSIRKIWRDVRLDVDKSFHGYGS